MLIQTNDLKHYSEMRKHWSRARNPFSKDPTEGVLRVTEAIADQMPDLGLPTMSLSARAAFKEVLMYERPPGNSSVEPILRLSEARGYCAHPCEWVPSSEGDDQFPALYQEWANWLAEEGYTPFYIGTPLTAENWHRWKPAARRKAFHRLWKIDQPSAADLLLNFVRTQPPSIRYQMLDEIGRTGPFGIGPSDVPVVRHFLNDPAVEIRDLAERKILGMSGFDTTEAHAKAVAEHIRVTDGGDILVSTDLDAYDAHFNSHCNNADLDTLADVIGLSAVELLQNFSLEYFSGGLYHLLMRTKDLEAKNVLARRLAEAGKYCPPHLFKSAEQDVWDAGLHVTFGSPYPSAVFDFLGSKAGTLDVSLIRKTCHYPGMIASVKRELETGELPVNKSYDPLRSLAFLANKEAAAELLEEARAAGISDENSRLSMLKFNLAL